MIDSISVWFSAAIYVCDVGLSDRGDYVGSGEQTGFLLYLLNFYDSNRENWFATIFDVHYKKSRECHQEVKDKMRLVQYIEIRSVVGILR